MVKTRITIEIEAQDHYDERELRTFAEQVCNFIAGPDGEGLNIGKKYATAEDRTFQILSVRFNKPEEEIWAMHLTEKK